jgi:hypothetical protein
MMKKYIPLLLLVMLAPAAHTQTPQFSMWVKFFINDNPGNSKEAYFGYDANASDSLEGKNAYTELMPGGEQMYPPPFQYNDIRFTGYTINRGYLGDGSPIDIRKKPDSSSFVLNYELSLTTLQEATSASLIWDKNLIPAIINHIYLEPATIGPGPGRKRTDMKTESRFDMPNRDSIGKYSKTLVTIYYNREPSSSVSEDERLDRSLTLSSNPISEQSAVNIFTDRTSEVIITMFDMTGRQILRIEQELHLGLNSIPLSKSLFPASGAYFVRIRTSDSHGAANTSRIVHVVK